MNKETLKFIELYRESILSVNLNELERFVSNYNSNGEIEDWDEYGRLAGMFIEPWEFDSDKFEDLLANNEVKSIIDRLGTCESLVKEFSSLGISSELLMIHREFLEIIDKESY